ncbi:MAG: OmpH family outer membrane protein [Brevundimonas sp.]|uniref:OmpH family outer membrane protein n=1 Tax=Brevundimonas sp. TaxID=1871086 RepID=UPI001A290974|nr:OmpH family outer membrane protein [Brevundimonas sp.]MBJ7447969.1 OmpH family outer membrane protein [Brevundimonas sp.]
MKLIALGAFALASLAAGTASAQTAGNINHGAPITGVCIYDNEEVLARSTAGQSVQAGMQRLLTEVQGELAPYSSSIQAEVTALQQGGEAADPGGTRRQALQARAQEAQQLQQTRSNELQYTQGVQLQAIGTAVEPIVIALYQERGCSILLNRSAIYSANPAMDITPTAIERLNAALPSLSFNRLTPPAQPQQ